MATNEVVGPYEQWSMVVIYDPKTGGIEHMHQAITTRGGAHPAAQALEQLAAEHATMRRKAPMTGMAYLHVNPAEIDAAAYYSVDVAKKALIRTDRTKARA